MDEETPHLWPGRTSSAFYLRLSFGFGAAGSGKVQYVRGFGGSGYVVHLRLRSGRIIKSTLRTSGGAGVSGVTDTCRRPFSHNLGHITHVDTFLLFFGFETDNINISSSS